MSYRINLNSSPLTQQLSPIQDRSNAQASTATTPIMHQNAGATTTNLSSQDRRPTQSDMSHTQPIFSHSTTYSSSSASNANFSSSSTSSSSSVADDALQELLGLAEDELNSAEIKCQKLLIAMHDFVKSSTKTKSDFLDICELLKASSKTGNAKNLPAEYKVEWLSALSKQTVAFLACANSQSDEVIGWHELSMNQVSQVFYALKASIEPNRYEDYFSNDQLLSLTPVLRGITRKLINRLHTNKLMSPTYRSNGDVLVVLEWLRIGLQLDVPTTSGKTSKLLSGAASDKIGIDAIFEQAIDYFLVANNVALDTRQLGKLFHSIGKILNRELLDLKKVKDGGQTLGQRLTNVILSRCKGNALQKYIESSWDNFGKLEFKEKPIDPVAVENLAEGLLAFMSHLFTPSQAGIGMIVNKMAGFIQQVLQSEQVSPSNLKMYASFLKKAHKENFAGTDKNEIKKTVEMVEKRIYSSTSSS